MKGVILAAGKGTRMLPLTEKRPKPLLPVLDRPMLEHIITGVRDAGLTDLLLIIAYKGEAVQEYFGDGSRFGVKITYKWQEGPAGTGAATALAQDFVGDEPFFVCWGDIVVGRETYSNLVRLWETERPRAILSVNYVADPYQGAAVYVENGCVSRIIEKPERGTSTTNYNNAGIFMFGPEMFEILSNLPLSPRGEKEMPDAVKVLMERGAAIRALEVVGYWSDVGRPASLLELNAAIIAHRAADGTLIAPGVKVSSGVGLEAPVYLGVGCEVGAARLGPNVALGQSVSVGDGAVLEQVACLGDNAIGAGSVLRWAVVDEGVTVPAGLAIGGTPEAPAVVSTP